MFRSKSWGPRSDAARLRQIYGEDEKLYGYKDLDIDVSGSHDYPLLAPSSIFTQLRFSSGSLVQYLNVRYSDKLGSSSTVDDVEGTLSDFIPPGYFKDEQKFLAFVEEDSTNFKPSGQLIHSYTRSAPSSANGKGKGKGAADSQALDSESEDAVVFEVYHATWNTPGFKEYHRRMQLFILLYIEGGSYINEDEDPWEFAVLFEKRKRKGTPNVASYHFVGYSSLYPFYFFPEKTRLRLSQFVILPPYQHQGHGSNLYNAIYNHTLSQPNIAELTVEDPAEAFEDLRDRNDLKMLLSNERLMEEGFGEAAVTHGGGRVGGVGRAGKSARGGKELTSAKGKLGPPSDKGWLEKWRKDLKIGGRQFQRLTEMLLLLRLDPSDARALRAYRIQVKERLYRFNF
ncbi:hypothetical protein DXG03_009096, partial [Asterophora parasitica]